MAMIRDILSAKNDSVLTIGESASVLEATQLMNQHKVGALVVGDGVVAGIFTERDVLRRVVAEQLDPAKATVGEVMTKKVACCAADASIDEARAIMKNKRIRHLPVVNENKEIEGMISIGDLNAWAIADDKVTIEYMEAYIYGRV